MVLGTAKAAQFFDVGFVPDFTITPRSLLISHVDVGPARGLDELPAAPRLRLHDGQPVGHLRFARGCSRATSGSRARSRMTTPSSSRLASRLAQNVKHLVGLKQLVVLTDNGGWRVGGDQAGALTPSAINADQELYVGAADPPPVIIGNASSTSRRALDRA